MPTRGKCKLCKRQRELQDSHFIGRAVYKKLRGWGLRNNNPVVVAGGVVDQSQAQLTDYVFCSECEGIFNLQGESWIHRHMATPQDFRLLELFKGVVPYRQGPNNFRIYDAAEVPKLEYDKLFHYGIGVFFKAAAHVWSVDGDSSHIKLNWNFREALRKATFYGAPLPKTVKMTITIADKPTPFLAVFPPVRTDDLEGMKYSYYVPGIFYTLFVGKHIPITAKAAARFDGIEKPVYVTPAASDHAREIMRLLVKNMQKSARVEWLIRNAPRLPS
jgi:hypothetical protein